MDFVPYQKPSGKWVLMPDRCFLADLIDTIHEDAVIRTFDRISHHPIRQGSQAVDNAKRLVSIVHRLPNEIKAQVFDHLAASQPEKYGHIIHPRHFHLFADDIFKHVPSIDTSAGIVQPTVDWIPLAEEAIAKNAIFHIDTDFSRPLIPDSVLQRSKHIHHLSMMLYSFHDHLEAAVIAKGLSKIKTLLPNLKSLDVIVNKQQFFWWTVEAQRDPLWAQRGKALLFKMMESIQAKRMLMVHDIREGIWIWHGYVSNVNSLLDEEASIAGL